MSADPRDDGGRGGRSRLFAAVLQLFPQDFRQRFAQDMAELFADQLRAARQRNGWRGAAAIYLRTLPALLRAAAAEHVTQRRQHGSHNAVPSSLPFESHQPRGDDMIDAMLADLRFAGRMLRKSPLFAVVSVVCIAIGSGAVTTVFSAMNALVLRPLPGAGDARRLLRMEQKRPGGTDGVSATYALFDMLRTRARSLDGVAAWGKGQFTVRSASDDGGVEVYGNFVSGNFFDVLRVRPRVGRFFTAAEDRGTMAHPVIVISERLWRGRFAGRDSIVGQTLFVSGRPYTVVGVAPAVFEGVDAPIATDVWLPLTMAPQFRADAPLTSPKATWLRLCGRLRSDVSVSAAHQELAALTKEYALEAGEPAWRIYTDLQLSALTGLPPDATGPLSAFLALLLGAAALVLLIASVNVASMLSARAIARRSEMAVRAALGASRGRLVRQLLTEILVLFVLGAAGGAGLATAATGAISHLDMPATLPIVLHISPDWRVLSFALVVSLITGLIFGLPPALRAAGTDIAARMRYGSAGSGARRGWLSNALIVGQLSLSLLLLVGAGLFARALDRGNHIDPGFDSRGVTTVRFDAESWGYSDARIHAFYRDLRDRIQALPSVTAVSYADYLPLTMRGDGIRLQPGGQPSANVDAVWAGMLTVDADYFTAVRVPLVAGRAITSTDDANAPHVAVVNETFARTFWPHENAVGQTIRDGATSMTVVGVARDGKYETLTEAAHPFVYFPLQQRWDNKQTLIVRTSRNPLAIAADIDRAVRSIDPTIPRPLVSTLSRENAAVLIPQRVAALVSGTLGAVGLLLAAVGLYGVIAHSSSRRRREIGIRLALGARSNDVLAMILREGLRVTAVGVVIGLALAAAATRLLSRFLFGVSPLDALTFVLMSGLFVTIALVATFLPARRAALVSPSLTLREE